MLLLFDKMYEFKSGTVVDSVEDSEYYLYARAIGTSGTCSDWVQLPSVFFGVSLSFIVNDTNVVSKIVSPFYKRGGRNVGYYYWNGLRASFYREFQGGIAMNPENRQSLPDDWDTISSGIYTNGHQVLTESFIIHGSSEDDVIDAKI